MLSQVSCFIEAQVSRHILCFTNVFLRVKLSYVCSFNLPRLGWHFLSEIGWQVVEMIVWEYDIEE